MSHDMRFQCRHQQTQANDCARLHRAQPTPLTTLLIGSTSTHQPATMNYCRFHKRGFCKKGADCTFEHTEEVRKSPEPAVPSTSLPRNCEYNGERGHDASARVQEEQSHQPSTPSLLRLCLESMLVSQNSLIMHSRTRRRLVGKHRPRPCNWTTKNSRVYTQAGWLYLLEEWPPTIMLCWRRRQHRGEKEVKSGGDSMATS